MGYRYGRQGPTEICTISQSHILTDWLLPGLRLVNLHLHDIEAMREQTVELIMCNVKI